MNKLILADNQAIFRAGAARVLAVEDDMRIVAQCDDAPRLLHAIDSFRSAIVLFGSSLRLDVTDVLNRAAASSSRAVLIVENAEQVAPDLLLRLDGVICRNIGGPELVECVRRVARGIRYVMKSGAETQSVDAVGARVRDRLTPKEMQIVALIVQGCKNKEIAAHLNTKEQVIKNYLRSIYDKTGVSDRLELALFTIHHRILAEAAARAGNLLQMKSA